MKPFSYTGIRNTKDDKVSILIECGGAQVFEIIPCNLNLNKEVIKETYRVKIERLDKKPINERRWNVKEWDGPPTIKVK